MLYVEEKERKWLVGSLGWFTCSFGRSVGCSAAAEEKERERDQERPRLSSNVERSNLLSVVVAPRSVCLEERKKERKKERFLFPLERKKERSSIQSLTHSLTLSLFLSLRIEERSTTNNVVCMPPK